MTQHCWNRAAHGGNSRNQGKHLVKCISGHPLPSSLSPNIYSDPVPVGIALLTLQFWFVFFFFFMTAILFNVAPEELCSIFQSFTYKSSLHLSLKCSYCCRERILEECGPAFHCLIWSMWFMVYCILLPLPAALLSWGLFCSISYSQGTNEL